MIFDICQYLMGAIVEDVRPEFEGRGDALVTIPEFKESIMMLYHQRLP